MISTWRVECGANRRLEIHICLGDVGNGPAKVGAIKYSTALTCRAVFALLALGDIIGRVSHCGEAFSYFRIPIMLF